MKKGMSEKEIKLLKLKNEELIKWKMLMEIMDNTPKEDTLTLLELHSKIVKMRYSYTLKRVDLMAEE